MDNYLSLLGRGLSKRKRFISRACDWIWLGNLSIPSCGLLPLSEELSFSCRAAKRKQLLFPGFKPKLSNYLIINY